jgi:hypothetical protein
VIYGSRKELLADAKQRIADSPQTYEPKVYGEHDAGGTQVLYLTAKGFDFEDLGLPDLGDKPVPELSETVQHGIYQGFVAPVAIYAALGLVLLRNRKKSKHLKLEGAETEAGKSDAGGSP